MSISKVIRFTNADYIKIRRKFFLETSFYKNPMAQALAIHLLLKANFKDKKTSVKHQKIMVRCGQILTNREKIAAEAGVSIQTVRACLSFLQNDGFLTIESNNGFLLITITNYTDYLDNTPQIPAKAISGNDAIRRSAATN